MLSCAPRKIIGHFMMKNILYSLVALFLVIIISSCGDESRTATQTEVKASVTLEADKSQVMADGIDGVNLTVTVKDASGAPLGKQPVILSVPPTFHYVHAIPLLTDDNGQVVLFISPLLRQGNPLLVFNDSITATCLGTNSIPVIITSWPVPPNSTFSVTLIADKVQAIADGREAITFTATVKDVNGIPIAGQPTGFKPTLGTSPFITSPRYTDNNGMAVIHLTYPPTQSNLLNTVISMSATSGGVTSNSVNVTYIKPSPALVTLVADKTLAKADGIDKITFTATAKDDNGFPIPYQNISFNVSPGADRYLSPVYTNANGVAVIHLSSSPTTLNDKVINVSATSGGITSNALSATFTAPLQVAPALVTLTSVKTTLIVDGNDQISFTITATDSNGLPLAGQAYHMNIPPGPYMSLIQILTNTAGQAFTSLHSILRQPAFTNPAVISVTATINGTTSNAISLALNPP